MFRLPPSDCADERRGVVCVRVELHALARMGRYPLAIRLLIDAVNAVYRARPILAPRKHFRASAREKQLDPLHCAASLSFLAVREL